MASRIGRRFISQVVRPSVRVTGRNAGATKRCMSTAEHGAHPTGSDTPWQIGSALVFGPAIVYLLYPSSTKGSHGSAHAHESHEKPSSTSMKDSEGKEEEVGASVQQAEDADAPKDAKATEEKQDSEQAPSTDADGEEEAKGSAQPAADADAPSDAKEQEGKYDSGSPGMTSEAEQKPDQKEKPQTQPHTGTLQSDDDSGPTNMGDARKTATSGEAPKEAKD